LYISHKQLLAECGGLANIEALQNHENQSIYQRVVRILEQYFNAEEEEDVAVAPNVIQGGHQYGFGSGAAPQGGFHY